MRLIDADALMRIYQEVLCPHVRCVDCSLLMDDETCRFETMIREAPAIDAVPVSKLEELRDYLYAEDLIFMRGLAELNKLIANCGAKMDGVEEREK